MNENWLFDDAPDTACYTSTFVLEGSPILRVYHDYDGDWQFHGAADQPSTDEVIRIVSLDCMVALDPSVAGLHDLAYGWSATRDTPEHDWIRSKDHPFPTHGENGYYLEDGIEMSQYFDEISPPPDDVRENIPVGTYVKLMFRFAAEDAERSDHEVERMWVLVTDCEGDGKYMGCVENDPHHEDTLAYGDPVRFHSSHVIEIL